MQESLNSLLVLLPSWPLCCCHIFYFEFSSVAQPSLTLCNLMDCSMPGLPLSITNSWSLLKLMSVESVMPSNHLILCRPLLLPTSLFPSIRVFLSEFFTLGGQRIGVSASASVLPRTIQDWLISFRTDWFDFIAVQGTLKSLQHHSLKVSILQHSAFFIVQHPYMTTGKTMALTGWTFVGKVMSLLFITMSRFAIAFLLRCKCLLI